MINRGAIIGIGTIILVIGLTGLGLLQTGVTQPTKEETLEPAPATSQQSQAPVEQTSPAAVPASQPGVEPGTKTSPAVAPAAQSGVEPGTKTGADLKESAGQGQQPPSGDVAAEKPVPVPQVGEGERRYPKQEQQEQVGQHRPPLFQMRSEISQDDKTTRKQKLNEKRKQAHPKSRSERYASKTPPAHRAQPVVIRFNFDPGRHRGLNVAQVHAGDKIRVKVRRVGQVESRVHFTLSRNINSQQGAVLKLETMYSLYHPVMYPTDRGYYVVEVKIYPGNRWNIMPRSYVWPDSV